MFNRAVRFPSVLAAEDIAWGKDIPNSPNWTTFSGPATEPEILATEEIQSIFQIDKSRLGITVCHEELTNFISWYQPQTNVGSFRGDGVELSFQCPLDDRTRLWGNVSYNDSRLFPFTQYVVPPNTAIQSRVESSAPGALQTTYGLVAADFHTFFIGKGMVLTHDNTIRPPTDRIVPCLAGKAVQSLGSVSSP